MFSITAKVNWLPNLVPTPVSSAKESFMEKENSRVKMALFMMATGLVARKLETVRNYSNDR